MSKHIIVTGAAGGIGTALIDAFIMNGDWVIAIDQTAGAERAGVTWITADLARLSTDEANAAALVDRIEAASGGRCEVLVNNAATQIVGDFMTLPIAAWETSLAVNLMAPVVLTRGLLRLMPAGEGVVINISSIHAHLTKPGFTAYAVSKAALSGLTRALAVELGARARFVTIEPAAIATPMLRAGFEGDPQGYAALESMHPALRIGLPEEVARLALMVSMKGMDFINGTAIAIDGAIACRLHDPA